jgi:hypothetical protein
MFGKLTSIIRNFREFRTHSGARVTDPASHPGDNLLEAYLMGTLQGDSIAELEEHLLSCHGCRLRMEERESFLLMFREAAGTMEMRPVRAAHQPRNYRSLAWGLAMSAAVVIGLVAVRHPSVSPAAPPAIVLHPFRGPQAPMHIQSGINFLLILDAPPASSTRSYQVQFVDGGGHSFRTAQVEARADRLTLACDRLARGVYWVRVYGSSVETAPLMEYRLQVE